MVCNRRIYNLSAIEIQGGDRISDTTQTHKFPLRYPFSRKFPSEPTKTHQSGTRLLSHPIQDTSTSTASALQSSHHQHPPSNPSVFTVYLRWIPITRLIHPPCRPVATPRTLQTSPLTNSRPQTRLPRTRVSTPFLPKWRMPMATRESGNRGRGSRPCCRRSLQGRRRRGSYLLSGKWKCMVRNWRTSSRSWRNGFLQEKKNFFSREENYNVPSPTPPYHLFSSVSVFPLFCVMVIGFESRLIM